MGFILEQQKKTSGTNSTLEEIRKCVRKKIYEGAFLANKNIYSECPKSPEETKIFMIWYSKIHTKF